MGAKMRKNLNTVLLLVAILSLASSLAAKEPQWQEATFYKITTSSSGAFVVPIGDVLIGGRITHTFYWFKTDEIIYVLHINKKRPNVTLHGKTKIAVKGRKAFILDDDGKKRKYRIAQKIAVEVPRN